MPDWGLTTLSTIFLSYRSSQFYGSKKLEGPERTTNLKQVSDKPYHVWCSQIQPFCVVYITPYSDLLQWSVQMNLTTHAPRPKNHIAMCEHYYLLHITLVGFTSCPDKNWANFLISILALLNSLGSRNLSGELSWELGTWSIARNMKFSSVLLK